METFKINDRPRFAPQDPGSLRGVKQSSKTQCVPVTTSDNNLDVDLRRHAGGQILSAKVYVLSKEGSPLMPTTPRKARLLLKDGRATVKRRTPFVIKLNFKTTSFIQDVKLGVDSGTKNIGISAVSGKKELIAGTVIIDTMMKKRLADRAMYRRQKRNNLWYREPRFNNRSKPEGWLPPSIERRYQTHLRTIDFVNSILPVSDVTIELGNFDTQKIKNVEIEGVEYQQGDMYGYQNMKAFLMAREKGLCQLCGKAVKGKKVSLHHIASRKTNSNKASNMALLHESCHKKLHKQGIETKLKKNKQFREHAFMNIMQSRIRKETNYNRTYGYITFVDRNELNLPKSHINDAFVVAGGTHQARCLQFEVTQKRKNNRSIQKNRKGFAPAIRKQRYPVQPMDLIKINGIVHIAKGTMSKGKSILLSTGKTISPKKIDKWIFKQSTLKWMPYIPYLKQGVLRHR